jgi:hypothetical protein
MAGNSSAETSGSNHNLKSMKVAFLLNPLDAAPSHESVNQMPPLLPQPDAHPTSICAEKMRCLKCPTICCGVFGFLQHYKRVHYSADLLKVSTCTARLKEQEYTRVKQPAEYLLMNWHRNKIVIPRREHCS